MVLYFRFASIDLIWLKRESWLEECPKKEMNLKNLDLSYYARVPSKSLFSTDRIARVL